jgi:hypothetical protein
LHKTKKQSTGFLAAHDSQNSHYQKNFKNDHLNKAVKKMVHDPAADDRRHGCIDEYGQFSWDIHI